MGYTVPNIRIRIVSCNTLMHFFHIYFVSLYPSLMKTLMKRYIIGFLLFCSVLHAREPVHPVFTLPFDFPLYLSANFGELRTNHFHGGLDFKTQGAVGKPVRCIADGYVSRITVSAGGYGNALYITHPNGYMSVYGHLDSFAPEVARYVEQYQYDHETFVADIVPDSAKFRFQQGDVIALSGNTGFSFGPHLHMEIRKTETNEPIDPLPFFRKKVGDKRAPLAHFIAFYPQAGKGVADGKSDMFTLRVEGKGASCLPRTVVAWGEIGVGISANDYMDGTQNNYGVRSVELYVDEAKIFHSVVDCFAFGENRAINSWVDYAFYKDHGKWIMKSFAAPGNPLRLLHTDENRGIVRIDQEKDYHFKYVLKDFHDNTSVYSFIVRGSKQSIPEYRPDMNSYLHYDRPNVIRKLGMQLTIPRGMLYEDVELNSVVRMDSSAISFEYQLHDKPVPLHAGCELMIGVRRLPVSDTTKYYIEKQSRDKYYSVGGYYENGWVKTVISELGTYRVAVDTIPPRITPLGKSSPSTRTIRYKVSDRGTGIKSYRGTVDDQFILVAYSAKNGTMTCHIDPERVSKGRHTFKLAVEDYCGNVSTIEKVLTY